MTPSTRPYWEEKSLTDMSDDEWERLCDGCAKCCLNKLQDADTDEIAHTRVACRLLDLTSCRCTRYSDRKRLVPDCVKVTADNAGALSWMPVTCAYRLLAEGKPLPDWHPLITGNPESVHAAGQSVRGRSVSERDVRCLERHIVEWPDL